MDYDESIFFMKPMNDASSKAAPTPQELLADLASLEQHLGIRPPSGLGKLPPAVRFAEVLNWLRSRLCPRKDSILAKVQSQPAEIITILTDALGIHSTGVDLPLTSLLRCVGIMGLSQFCKNPADLLPEE